MVGQDSGYRKYRENMRNISTHDYDKGDKILVQTEMWGELEAFVIGISPSGGVQWTDGIRGGYIPNKDIKKLIKRLRNE